MKAFFSWFIRLFTDRRIWVRQITVAALASATAWVVGDSLVFKGGLVAAIVCALSIRISLYKSVREGLGQIVSTLIGAAVAIIFSYFSHPNTPAGRTVNQITRLGKRGAELISDMAEGVAGGFTQKQAGAWLSKARLLVEEIPTLRSQAIEAKRYAKWSPLAEVDVAESLYIQGVAIEHMVVQIRGMARALFDSTSDPNRKDTVDRQIAYALSATSNAITEKLELLQSSNRERIIDNIARDLRQAADNLTEELIAMADKLPRSQFVRCIAIVSQMKIIANSLDESSPALHSVTTPGEPTSAKVIGLSPVKQTTRLYRRILMAFRTFLRR